MGDGSDITEYDRGRSYLSNVAFKKKQNTTSIEKRPLNLNLRFGLTWSTNSVPP